MSNLKFPPARSMSAQARAPSAGDDQIHGLGAFALLVRLDVETDLLSFIQALQSGLLHGGDVHEHIASAIVRFHKSVAAFAIEELHNASLRHREHSLSPCCSATGPTRGGSAGHSHFGESIGHEWPQSLRRPPRTGGGTSLPMMELHTNWVAVERAKGTQGGP